MDIITNTPESELLAALHRALEELADTADEPNTVTSSEFAEHLGLEQSAGTRRLKKLMKAGVLEPAMIRRTDAWGRTKSVTGYRLATINKDS